MATLSLANVAQQFPAGTVVKAFPQKGFPVNLPSAGLPAGTEAGSATVAASGSLSITGLVEQTYYLLASTSPANVYMLAYIEAAGEITVIATQATGDFAVMTAGKGFRVKEGSNAKQGQATLISGKATVANTSVTASSRIILSPGEGAITNAGYLVLVSQTEGVGFKVESLSAPNTVASSDVRTFSYQIFEPA